MFLRKGKAKSIRHRCVIRSKLTAIYIVYMRQYQSGKSMLSISAISASLHSIKVVVLLYDPVQPEVGSL